MSPKICIGQQVVSWSTEPVSEYYNPSLFPGMFPTLFPYGIRGFKDDTREVAIAFRAHVEYLLDLADRRFRYYTAGHSHEPRQMKDSYHNIIMPSSLH